MLQVELKNTKDKNIVFKLPENGSEITLDSKLEYDFCMYRIAKFFSDNSKEKSKRNIDTSYKNRDQYIMIIAKGISLIYDVSINDLLAIDGTELQDMTFDDFHKNINELAGESLKNYNRNQLQSSLFDIFTYTGSIIRNTKPDILCTEINYKVKASTGEDVIFNYKLPSYLYDELWKKNTHKSITYKQAIETIRVNNNYHNSLNELILENEEAANTDKNKNLLFTKYVSEVALLLTSETNKMPTDTTDFNLWFNKRIKHFMGIDWQTVLNISHWFYTYLEELETIPANSGFFDSAYNPETKEEIDAWRKAVEKSKEIYKKIGHNSLFNLLMEYNPFQKPGESKKESILNSPFTDDVEIISSHNLRNV